MGAKNPVLEQPFAEWEEVEVTFPATPGTDLVVQHTLNPKNPEAIGYIPVRKSAAAHVYHNTAFNRKAWQNGYILLRSDVASVKVRLLLYVGSSTLAMTF